MSDQLYRAEHYRDLAAECRRLAVTSFSAQMRNRYWRMAENYRTLAEAEEAGRVLAHGGLAALRQLRPNAWRLARAAYRPRTQGRFSPATPPARLWGLSSSREQRHRSSSSRPRRGLPQRPIQSG